MPDDLETLRSEVKTLREAVRRLESTRPRADFGAMQASVTGRHLLLGAGLVVPLNAAARTDTAAADGLVQAYIDGATTRWQQFNKTAGAWRETTLT